MGKLHEKLVFAFFALCTAAALLFGMLPLPAYAAGSPARLVDRAGLLTDSEAAELQGLLDAVSERRQIDVVVVTVDSLEGNSAQAYADDFYDENGYGFGDGRDGILLLLSMEEREWYITTSGYGITAVTDAGRAHIADIIVEDLSAGSYAAAFTEFANLCDEFAAQADAGEPYDVGNLPRESMGVGVRLLLAFGIAFVIALLVTGIMRGQLKTVRSQSNADNYVKPGSMQVTKRNDLFLYRHVERRKRQENNSHSSSGGSRTHTSSSGRTHGGGGGKF